MKVVEKMWVRWWRVVTWGNNVAVVVAGTGTGTGTGTADGGGGGGTRVAATVEVVMGRSHLWGGFLDPE